MSKTKETPEALRPYEFFGLDFSVNGTQATGNCPFCDSTKFFINKKTGQYDCKKCGQEGNKYTFFRDFHKLHLQMRTQNDIKRIRKQRGTCFSSQFIRGTQLCYDDEGNILFPHYRPGKDNPVNLRKWSPKSKILYNTPGCSSLYFHQWKETGPIYLVEGEWDAIALHQLFIKAKHDLSDISIVAVPGANVFKDNWSITFQNRDIYVLYDNDDAGRQGAKKVVSRLGATNRVWILDWPKVEGINLPGLESPLPDKFDIRDYLTAAVSVKKSKLYTRSLLNSCGHNKESEAPKPKVKPLKRTSFDQVVDDFQKHLEFSQSFIDVLACCYATMVTLYMSHTKKNPLWMFIVAPASSGKTTIIEAFDACSRYTEQLSKLTPASLVTGLNITTESDPSLLQHLRDKVLMVKDFTPVLNMGGDKDQIFGILRDAYDGAYVARFATGVREYKDLYFGIIAGVTHAIERVNLTELGERFLRVRLIDDTFDELAHIEKALINVDLEERSDFRPLFQASVLGYFQHMVDNIYQPTFPPEMNRRLAPLAQFAALCRTSVPRAQNREMYYRPSPEVASRIATQIKKLGIGLALVYGKKRVDDDCYRVMKKVAFDSSVGWKLELVEHIQVAGDKGITCNQLADKMQIHQNQVRKIIEDAQQLRMVDHLEGVKSHKRGTRPKRYIISPTLQRILDAAKVDFSDGTNHETRSTRTKRSKIKN